MMKEIRWTLYHDSLPALAAFSSTESAWNHGSRHGSRNRANRDAIPTMLRRMGKRQPFYSYAN